MVLLRWSVGAVKRGNKERCTLQISPTAHSTRYLRFATRGELDVWPRRYPSIAILSYLLYTTDADFTLAWMCAYCGVLACVRRHGCSHDHALIDRGCDRASRSRTVGQRVAYPNLVQPHLLGGSSVRI